MNDAGIETVRKIYVRDLKEKEKIETVFRVEEKSRQTARTGKSFLTLTLVDRTGRLDGRVFDNVEAVDPAFATGDYVLVAGQVISFHRKLQLLVESLTRLEPEPIDPVEFTPPPLPVTEAAPSARVAQASQHAAPKQQNEWTASEATPKGGAVRQIRELIERVQDPQVRALLLAFLDDPEVARGLPLAPAAKGIHHAYPGGLADHVLSVMRLAHRMADHYPMVDRDLMLAGAFLHDIGKVSELRYDKNTEYTDEGRLVGHLVMTAQKIHVIARSLPNFPPLLEHHLTHLVLAHHGQLAYGSPKEPLTLEAYLVHMVDTIDSRVASWLDLMARDPNENWTERSKLYDRHLWKGTLPTARNRGPVDPKKRRQRPPRSHGKTHEGGEKPPLMAFKPLEALAPQEIHEDAKNGSPSTPASKDS